MKVNWQVFSLIFLALISSLKADSFNWSLSQCEEYALSHSPILNSGELEEKMALMEEITSISSILPQISASGYRTHNLMIAEMPMKMPGTDQKIKIRMGQEYNLGGSLKISQNLFAGGSIYHSWKMNRYLKNASKEDFEYLTNQVVLSIRTMFYQIKFLEKQKTALSKAKDRALENLKTVETLYRSGGASEFELLRAKVDYRNTLPQLNQTEDNLKVSVLQFKKTIGFNLKDTLTIADSFKVVESNLDLDDLDRLKGIALENRSDLKKLEWQKKSTDNGVWLSFSGYLPKVVLEYENGYQANLEKLEMFNVRNEDWSHSIQTTIGVSMPLFTGFKNTSQYLKSRMNRAKMKYLYEDKMNEVLVDVEKSYQSLHTTKKDLDTYQVTLEQAKEGYRLAKLLYENEGASQLDLLTAQSSLTQAESMYYQAIMEYNKAYQQLLFDMGLDKLNDKGEE